MNYSSNSEHCTTLPKLCKSTFKQKNIEYFEQLNLLTNPSETKLSENSGRSMDSDLHNDLSRSKTKHLFKKQCHKSWPDIYSAFDGPKLRRSSSFDTVQMPDCLLEHSSGVLSVENSEISSPKLLDVNYEQLLNDNAESNRNQLKSNENKLNNHNDLPKRKKRRSKLFTLPLKILEETDDDTRSNISDGTRTLIPYDEMPSSKYMVKPGLVSRYFPGQDLFTSLSSGQFVQANAELDRENAHFNISEAIIGTIEQVSI